MRSRLGDDIDDFCVKCKRVMNHLVVSLLNDEPAKVRCRTCHGDHDFRHEQAPPPKIDARKAALIQQALLAKAASASSDAEAVNGEANLDGVPEIAVADPAQIAAAMLGTAGLATAAMTPMPEPVNELAIPAPTRATARKNARAK